MKQLIYLSIAFGIMCFSSCQMQKRVTIPSGGQLIAKAPVVKPELKQDSVVKPVVKAEVKPVIPTTPTVPPPVLVTATDTLVTVAKTDEKVVSIPKEEQKVRRETFAVVDVKDAVEAKRHYHVVVGSFGQQDNANRLRALLSTQGYTPIVVVNESGMFRVIINSCETYDDAHRAADKVRSTYPDAWILAQK